MDLGHICIVRYPTRPFISSRLAIPFQLMHCGVGNYTTFVCFRSHERRNAIASGLGKPYFLGLQLGESCLETEFWQRRSEIQTSWL
jgi:hypothetical protein